MLLWILFKKNIFFPSTQHPGSGRIIIIIIIFNIQYLTDPKLYSMRGQKQPWSGHLRVSVAYMFIFLFKQALLILFIYLFVKVHSSFCFPTMFCHNLSVHIFHHFRPIKLNRPFFLFCCCAFKTCKHTFAC